MSIESRNITLYCPTCGNDQFSAVDDSIESLSDAPDDTEIKCADCGRVMTKSELIEGNQDIIDANVEDIKQETMRELERKFKRLFK